ncbi:aminotransferase class V-fold PLP-dependent enzyme [Robiginitalea sp. IMCC43444]|uniref:aminotransferase class V-fold PLP-dependent enzyme n=1 Tax=Robiginitalea sp. IMCC43444 TaxID=3459121 RepID=UPI0040424747
MEKRTFLKRMGQFTLAAPCLLSAPQIMAAPYPRPYPGKDEPDFWERIREDYALKPDYINLENGYYNIIPRPTLSRFMEHVSRINYEGSYYMRTVQWENKSRIAGRLARFLNCRESELAITRNTTESLDLVISGFPWKPGDEAIFAEQDYGAMQDQFRMISRRYGVVNKVVSVPSHPASDQELVDLYEQQISPKTRLLMICHMINITGQILPVRKICDMAHRHGVEVMVDGAHCVGHIPVDLTELDCDYYGSSLHKWLSTPLGAGILYVKEDKVEKIWPLLAEHKPEPGHIRKLNHTGTHPVHTDLAIENAMDYLELMGLERKAERLQSLQRYWTDALRGVDKIQLNTPEAKERSCGIANVGILGMEPAALSETLLDEFGIFTVAINSPSVKGCRITPNVYTRMQELDAFIEAMKTLARRA